MDEAELIYSIILGVGSILLVSGAYIFEKKKLIYNFFINSFNKNFSSSIFKEKEINIIIKYLEEKYLNEIKNDLNDLFPLLIKNKKFLTKLSGDIQKLSLKKKKKYFF